MKRIQIYSTNSRENISRSKPILNNQTLFPKTELECDSLNSDKVQQSAVISKFSKANGGAMVPAEQSADLAKSLERKVHPPLSEPSSLKFDWMDSREAADFLRISLATLRNLTSAGTVPFYKLGRRNRFRREELEALLLQNKRGKVWG